MATTEGGDHEKSCDPKIAMRKDIAVITITATHEPTRRLLSLAVKTCFGTHKRKLEKYMEVTATFGEILKKKLRNVT